MESTLRAEELEKMTIKNEEMSVEHAETKVLPTVSA